MLQEVCNDASKHYLNIYPGNKVVLTCDADLLISRAEVDNKRPE